MEEQAKSLQGLRILVAEDEFLILLQIEEILGGLGCEIVGPMCTVASAVAGVADNELDGALLDMNLRGELVTAAAEKLLEKGVPFLFVTGYGRRPGKTSVFHDAPRLSKPFNRQSLSAAMVDAFASPR